MDIEITEISLIKKDLSNEERTQFDSLFVVKRKDPTTALILGLLLGAVGIDRFYIGDTGIGVGKLCTLGGLGIWALIDLFLIKKATRERNRQHMQQIHDSIVQMRS